MISNFFRPALLASAISLSPTSVLSNDKVDPAGYPELSSEVLLPQLVGGLKRTLPDAWSIRDLIVCPAHNITIVDGHPDSWTLSLALNSKNETGGYTGITSYAATFKHGRIDRVFKTSLPGKDPLDALLNNAILKRLASCPSVPDAQLQKLLIEAKGL